MPVLASAFAVFDWSQDVGMWYVTRPVYHKQDETIWGHVFCGFLTLVLRKELNQRLKKVGHQFEWEDIKRDLMALQEVSIKESGRKLAIRTASIGTCGKVFQAVHVATPRCIRDV